MLLFAVILTTTLLTCGAQEYYVTPTPPPNPNCPSNEICETLSYYAVNGSTLLSHKDNVSLIFLEGDHSTTEYLYVQKTNFMTVMGNVSKESVSILIPFFHLETNNLVVMSLSFINSSTYFYSSTYNATYGVSMLLKEILLQNSYVLANSYASVPNMVIKLVDVQANADSRNVGIDIVAINARLFILNCIFQQTVSLLLYPDQQLETIIIQDSVFEGVSELPALHFQAYP